MFFAHDNRAINNPASLKNGFTLIELLTTVLIIAVITAIAIPYFDTMLEKWEARKVQNSIFNAFRQAQNISFVHHIDVIMCLADADNVCNRDAQDYLLLFTDNDGDHKYEVDNNTIILKQNLKLNYGALHLHASSRRHYLKYFGDTGMPRGNIGHFSYCPTNGNTNNMYEISLNMQGNTRFKPYSLTVTDCP